MNYYPHRTYCAVLEDMRACYKTYNFGPIAALIEELQVYGNRMEAGLGEKKDLVKLSEERHELKAEVKALEQKRERLQEKRKKR